MKDKMVAEFSISNIKLSVSILMDGTPTFQLGGHTNDPRRLLHKCFKTFPCIFALWWGMGRESIFGEVLWWGNQPLCTQFLSL